MDSDPKTRKETLKKAEKVFMDAMPIIPLYNPSVVFEKKIYVKDVYVSNLGSIDFKWAYITEH
jgi:oligopeptide transport system substrate-binding protein